MLVKNKFLAPYYGASEYEHHIFNKMRFEDVWFCVHLKQSGTFEFSITINDRDCNAECNCHISDYAFFESMRSIFETDNCIANEDSNIRLQYLDYVYPPDTRIHDNDDEIVQLMMNNASGYLA